MEQEGGGGRDRCGQSGKSEDRTEGKDGEHWISINAGPLWNMSASVFFFFFSCHTCTNSDTCRQNEHTNPFSAAETRSGECWPSLLLTSVESAPPVCLLFEKWDISSIVPPQHTHNPIETAELKPPWDGELRHNVQYVLQGWLIGRLGRHFPRCGFIIPSNHQ